MKRLFLFVGVVATASLVFGSPAHADPASKRHLVYNFTVGVQSDERTDASSAGTWDNRMKSTIADKGQISVDYLGVQTDGGLVVNVAESAETNRTLAAAMCIVYPDTSVQCGTGSTNPEEITVLRSLSPKFFNPTALDANRHWKIAVPAAGVSIDFTATPKDAGIISIASQRVEKSEKGDSTSANATYTYSPTRYLPTDLKEYTLMHEQSRPGQYANITIDITAALSSDSLAGS